MTNQSSRTPVLIVGAGPVGLTVALELSHHGVPSILIDRSPTPTAFPKMDITNGRSMELFRRTGFAQKLRNVGVAPHHSFDVIWALPNGEPYGHWSLPSVDEQRARIAARNDGSQPLEPDQRAQQSKFEQLGRTLCRADPLIDFREGVGFESLTQQDDGVTVTTYDRATDATSVFQADYVVGADGAGSRVRDTLGIATDQIGQWPKNYMVHFRSTDFDTLHRHGPFWHWFSMGAVIIAQDEESEWTFHCPLIHGEPDVEPDPADLIEQLLGVRIRIDDVLLTSIWQPRFALAERYAQGRVFLAGDSVHQVFPTGGYGMNTGVGDAVDIGWKLAAVVNGWGGQRLLDSYDAERRPVGARNRLAALRHLDVHIGTVERTIAGVPPEQLRSFVEGRRGENEYDGIEFGYRYDASPVIVPDPDPDGAIPPRVSEWDYIPGTWPGMRPPSVLLPDGSALFDHFGKGMTLIDFVGDASARLGGGDAIMPLTIAPIADPHAHRIWERNYVLVRPDQHVAWRSDILPDAAQWAGICAHVCGK